MTALYRSPSLRQIETACADQPLMERAGAAAAQWAEELAIDRNLPILVLAGPGNNGGDAMECARLLRERFFDVRLVFSGLPSRLPADARGAHNRFVEGGGVCLDAIPEVSRWGLIIDGIFGIGLARAPEGRYAEWIDMANTLADEDRCPLLALDCPSGLDGDTGRCYDQVIQATHTITFIAAKPGLYTGDGPDYCGEIRIADLGLQADDVAAAEGRLVEPALFDSRLVPRRHNSHKG
ncbi:MAG: NAD(P)H-hydrate epimerase, partial [Actinomycetota bacterium]